MIASPSARCAVVTPAPRPGPRRRPAGASWPLISKHSFVPAIWRTLPSLQRHRSSLASHGPIAGAASDRIGRRPILIATTLLALGSVYPSLVWLVNDPTFGKMLLVELWLSLLYAWYNGAMVVALTEVIPASVRTSGFSLAYSLATTLGGSSLAISTWLIRVTGDNAAPGYWMSFAALCGLVATLAIYAKGPRTDAAPAAA